MALFNIFTNSAFWTTICQNTTSAKTSPTGHWFTCLSCMHSLKSVTSYSREKWTNFRQLKGNNAVNRYFYQTYFSNVNRRCPTPFSVTHFSNSSTPADKYWVDLRRCHTIGKKMIAVPAACTCSSTHFLALLKAAPAFLVFRTEKQPYYAPAILIIFLRALSNKIGLLKQP